MKITVCSMLLMLKVLLRLLTVASFQDLLLRPTLLMSYRLLWLRVFLFHHLLLSGIVIM